MKWLSFKLHCTVFFTHAQLVICTIGYLANLYVQFWGQELHSTQLNNHNITSDIKGQKKKAFKDGDRKKHSVQLRDHSGITINTYPPTPHEQENEENNVKFLLFLNYYYDFTEWLAWSWLYVARKQKSI